MGNFAQIKKAAFVFILKVSVIMNKIKSLASIYIDIARAIAFVCKPAPRSNGET